MLNAGQSNDSPIQQPSLKSYTWGIQAFKLVIYKN